MFQIYQNPAENVEYLTLQGKIVPPKKIRLNEVFPELRELTLYSIYVSDPNIFDVKFPHLNQVTIKYQPMVDEKFEIMKNGKIDFIKNAASRRVLKNAKLSVQNLFEKNPQIKNVVLDHCASDYIYTVVNTLPNLKTFNTSYIS